MYFYVCAEITANKPAHSREDIMIPDEANGISDDEGSKSSVNIVVTNQSRVACNGGDGPLGHPQVFLTLGNDGRVTCPYCSRVFIKATD